MAAHKNGRKCWWCMGSLCRHPASGNEIFVEVVDPIGNKHKVHKTCKEYVKFGDTVNIDPNPYKPPHQ